MRRIIFDLGLPISFIAIAFLLAACTEPTATAIEPQRTEDVATSTPSMACCQGLLTNWCMYADPESCKAANGLPCPGATCYNPPGRCWYGNTPEGGVPPFYVFVRRVDINSDNQITYVVFKQSMDSLLYGIQTSERLIPINNATGVVANEDGDALNIWLGTPLNEVVFVFARQDLPDFPAGSCTIRLNGSSGQVEFSESCGWE